MDAIKSPVRERIIAVMGALGPCSIKDVAEHMRWRPESLFYHFRKLIDVGFVVEQGKRAAVRRPETVYRLASRRFTLDRNGASRSFLNAASSLYDSQTRGMTKRVRKALFDKKTVHTGAGRNLSQSRHFASMDRKALAGLNRKLEELVEYILKYDDPTGDGQTLAIILAMSPASWDD